MTNGEMLYQKFRSSSQERVRLELALQGFFLEETEESCRQAFAQYLQRRIRPAAQALIQADALPQLQKLEACGWLAANVVEDCLIAAIRLKKTQAFIWLLGLKAEKYDFSDRKFDL